MTRRRQAPTQAGRTKMSSDMNQMPTRVTVEHFVAGLAVWAVLMVIYAIV